MKKLLPLMLIVIAVVVFFLYPSGDDASEIEAVIDEALSAAIHKDIDGVMDKFSLHYRDEYGASYVVVKGLMKRAFKKYDSLDGGFSDLAADFTVSDSGDKLAVANFDIHVSGIKSGIPIAVLGTPESPQNITVTLKKSTLGGWQIISVEDVQVENVY